MKIKGYSIPHSIYLGLCYLITKLFYRNFRLIRFPFRLRLFGKITGGNGFTSGVGCRVDIFDGAELNLGNNIQINDYCHIACSEKIRIGNNVLIASKVYISDHDHDLKADGDIPKDWPLISIPVNIGDNCWIGEGVVILKGVELGKNCVVGANAVITKSFPNNSILVGIPAKPISLKP